MSRNCKLFDPNVPQALKSTQEWFASIITRPIDEDSKMNLTSPSNRPMSEEAQHYIAPSPTLQPHQRIELYNQQYWWRLLSTLHETFPLLTRLFGYAVFNQTIGIPYLETYPPNHWSLTLLGSRLVQWLEECYHEEDRQFILNAAKLDRAFDCTFLAPAYPKISASEDSGALAEQTLYLQPYVALFHFPYDLLSFRTTFNEQDGDHWITHDFPELSKEKNDYYFVLYRTPKNILNWKPILAGEYFLLTSFKKGATVEQACEALEQQGEFIYNEASTHIASWFQEWMARRWLCLSNSIQGLS
jgi:hypothetical protein